MIIDHKDWDLSEKGSKDAERHRRKVDDQIRKNVRDVIAEESVITQRKGKTIRIPIKGLKDYRFIYGGNDGGGLGIGSGDGKPGDIIGRKGKPGQGQKGKGGNQKGTDEMETEVSIDYLLEIMFEDLGLPYIEEKTKKEQLVPKGWKFETISKVGINSRIHKNRSMIEGIKRTSAYIIEIVDETGCSDEDALRALAYTKGDIKSAIDIIKQDRLDETPVLEDNYFIIEDDDLRYKQIEEDIEYHSNAVVIAMMDVSGSMTSNKKYLARSMLFWMTEFLKKQYDNVIIKFITHTTDAKVVDEDSFFHVMESGGTYCSSAFVLANYIIDTEFPVNEWNVYCVYISDGEDFDTDVTITQINEMISKKVNMIAYTEIIPEEEESMYGGWSYENTLLKSLRKTYDFILKEEDGTIFLKNNEKHLIAGVLKKKEHVYPMLKHILFKEG